MDRGEQMRAWLAERERRGLTFRELSAETGVPVGTLANWSWRLRHGVEVNGRKSRSARNEQGRARFVEVVDAAPRTSSRIEIALAGDRRVIVDGEFDEERLARVVRALERC